MNKFNVDDVVVYINDYGVNFGGKRILGVENDPIRGYVYYISPTSSPWFAESERNLFSLDDFDLIDSKTVVHYNKKQYAIINSSQRAVPIEIDGDEFIVLSGRSYHGPFPLNFDKITILYEIEKIPHFTV